jgi:hypothetical protein
MLRILVEVGFFLLTVQFWVWVNSFLLVSCLSLVATLIFVSHDAFHIARHLAAEIGTKLAVLI